jgi:hypothetical protein
MKKKMIYLTVVSILIILLAPITNVYAEASVEEKNTESILDQPSDPKDVPFRCKCLSWLYYKLMLRPDGEFTIIGIIFGIPLTGFFCMLAGVLGCPV